jgi:hypothetical protein
VPAAGAIRARCVCAPLSRQGRLIRLVMLDSDASAD